MARPASDQPTGVELEILQILWEHGPCPLGSIHDAVLQRRESAYSSTRKMVQIMREKGLIDCDDSVRPQLYRAKRSRDDTQLGMIDDLVSRAFDGSTKKLLVSLLSNERVSPDEMKEMQRLVRQAKQEKKS